jgi:hypothetical protein
MKHNTQEPIPQRLRVATIVLSASPRMGAGCIALEALREMRAYRGCDSSPSQPATRHFQATGHPIAASFERGV